MRFRARQRLRASQEFANVRKEGVRYRHNGFIAQAKLVEYGNYSPRLGMRVSRKVGNAVTRNRVKRIVRELFRLQQSNLPSGCDLIIIPHPNFLSLDRDCLNKSFAKLCVQLRPTLAT